jgi:hypothetical protein
MVFVSDPYKLNPADLQNVTVNEWSSEKASNKQERRKSQDLHRSVDFKPLTLYF